MNDIDIVTGWNRQHAPGTQVKVLRRGKLGLQTTTRSAAYIDGGRVMIRVNGLKDPCPLSQLQVAEVNPKGTPR